MRSMSPSSSAAVKQAINRLLDSPTRRFLVERVLPDPAKEPSGHITGRRVQLWRKYWLMDRLWRRLAFFAYHVYETVIGSVIESRARRNGLFNLPGPTTRSR